MFLNIQNSKAVL